MSKRIDKLLAAAAETDDEEKKGEPGETPETPAEPAPKTPAEPAPETPAEPAPETPAEPAPETPEPAPETPAEPENDDDEDADDECKPASRKALALLERRLDALVADNSRLKAENEKLAEDVGRLRAMLRDPSFAAAAMRGEAVPGGGDAAPATLSRAQADAAYAKITDPRERAKFREAHRAELGLR